MLKANACAPPLLERLHTKRPVSIHSTLGDCRADRRKRRRFVGTPMADSMERLNGCKPGLGSLHGLKLGKAPQGLEWFGDACRMLQGFGLMGQDPSPAFAMPSRI